MYQLWVIVTNDWSTPWINGECPESKVSESFE